MTIRVLLADDHDAIRAGLRALLEVESDLEVVGEAADGQACLTNAAALKPDVVVMDVRMPRMDGIAATEQVVAAGHARVLVLTTFGLDEYVTGAIAAGAAGYVLKTIDGPGLADAIRRVAAGEGVLAPEVTRQVLASVAAAHGAQPAREVDVSELTEREREVLAGLGRGLSNLDLARELGVSEPTIKTHVSRVLTKTGSRSRVQAALLARDAGLS
ncbi:response regulator [Dermacoccaceae bacterium W4C1]